MSSVGKGMLLVPAAHGQSPLRGPTLQGSHPFGPCRAEMLSRHAHRGFHPRLLMLLPFGEHGRVKPLRVSLVEPVACAKAVTGASHLYQNLWVKAPSSRPPSSSSICAGPCCAGAAGFAGAPGKS